MDLRSLKPAPGSTQARKRVGRGPGSGLGKTSGRGHKGRGARSGGNTPPGYEGGQNPLQRRLPKRGFTNRSRQEYNIVNLRDLDAAFDAGAVVDRDALDSRGLLRRKHLPVKILGEGEIGKALTVRADRFSKSARERLESAGGSAEVAGA
jgi:large subunit ribosomal protein L15